MPVKSDQTLGWTRRSAAISVLLVLEEQRKRAGERVVKLREARNWSQEDLARRSGLSTKTISRFENGRHEGRNDTIRKLAKALQVAETDITGPPPAPLGLDSPPPRDDIQEQLDALNAKVDLALEGQARLLDLFQQSFQHWSDQGDKIHQRLDELQAAVRSETDALLPGVRELLDLASESDPAPARARSSSKAK